MLLFRYTEWYNDALLNGIQTCADLSLSPSVAYLLAATVVLPWSSICILANILSATNCHSVLLSF
jgi:hypothetical protein